MINKLITGFNRYTPAIYVGPLACWCLLYPVLDSTLFYPLITFFLLYNLTAFWILEKKFSFTLQLLILSSLGLFFSILLGYGDIGIVVCFFLSFLLDLLIHVYLSKNKNQLISIWFVLILIIMLFSSFYPSWVQQSIQSLGFLLLVSLVLAQAQNQLSKESKQSINFIFLSSGFKLSLILLSIQSLLLLFIKPVMQFLEICSQLVLTCFSWIMQTCLHMMGFVFTLLITLIQNMIRSLLINQSSTSSKDIVSVSPDATQQLQQSVQQLNPFFQLMLLVGIIIATLVVIFLVFRYLIKLIKQTTKSTQDSGFVKESSYPKKEKKGSLQESFARWIHLEKVAPYQKKYRQAVNCKIKEGIEHHSQDTPNEYLKKVENVQLDEEFSKLTVEYNKQRYNPK